MRLPFNLVSLVLCLLAMILVPGCGGGFLGCPGSDHDVPLMVYITPESVTLQPGASQTFRVQTNPLDESISLDFSAGILDCTPDNVTGNTPIDANATVTVPAGTPPGQYQFMVLYGNTSNAVGTATITVEETGSGDPTFTFTASPLIVTTMPTTFSDPVTFTLNSVNGFTGDVSIDWGDMEGAVPSDPEPRPFVVNVAPGTPTTFTRRFYRYAENGLDIPITFTATSGEITRSVTITTRDAP